MRPSSLFSSYPSICWSCSYSEYHSGISRVSFGEKRWSNGRNMQDCMMHSSVSPQVPQLPPHPSLPHGGDPLHVGTHSSGRQLESLGLRTCQFPCTPEQGIAKVPSR